MRKLDDLEASFREQIEKERNRRQRNAARVSWASIFGSVLRVVIPMAGAATASFREDFRFDKSRSREKEIRSRLVIGMASGFLVVA